MTILSYTYTINTTGVPNGNSLYWGLAGTDLTDFVATSGSITCVGSQSDFSLQINESTGTDGDRPFTIHVAQQANPVANSEASLACTLVDEITAPVATLDLPGSRVKLYLSGGSGSGSAQIQLIASNDGTMKFALSNNAGVLQAAATYSTWLPSGATATDYEVKFTQDSTLGDGAPPINTNGATSFVSLGSTRSWVISTNNTEGAWGVAATVEIRLIAQPAVTATDSLTMFVTQEP